MATGLREIEKRLFARFHREAPESLLARFSFWLLLVSVLFLVLSFLPAALGKVAAVLAVVGLCILLFCVAVLIYRAIFARLLWRVSNRLIVTYLLMGLAPVILFVSLAALAAYLFSGQFATYAATSALQAEVGILGSEDRAFALHVGHLVSDHPELPSVDLPELAGTAASGRVGVAVWQDGRRMPVHGEEHETLPATLPGWLNDGFRGLVIDQHAVYLRAVDTMRTGRHTVSVLSSRPLNSSSLDALARGLGSVRIVPGADIGTADEDPGKDRRAEKPAKDAGTPDSFAMLSGGNLQPPTHFYDRRVFFWAPLKTFDWQSGQSNRDWILVTSRPTLLYSRLTGTALLVGSYIRTILISVAIFFAVLEMVAFIMALRLSRTITRSVQDLYQATTEMDRGNFGHRIAVRRRDQLAALSVAFNTMSESVERLLEQQREKERLQGELAIAQEVQNNLYPHSQLSFPGLELHGACHPARTVSGDYYDFILVGAKQLCMALGDISGKGISAALLMASLHSAVRAYQFAGEDQAATAHAAARNGESPLSMPGHILELLNRHLYRSTQPEKYATLFLAFYDGVTRKLTYSNGGQLPPLVLCSNGAVKRLDCGGSVVGLLDGERYQQASLSLTPGDVVVLYSDGVTEPENEFGDFGEDRLVELVMRNRQQPLSVISAQVMIALRDWIGTQEQPDDITLVLARQL